jgi:hypothetical protein
MTYITDLSLKHNLIYLEALLAKLIKKHIELRWLKGTVLEDLKKFC